MESGVQIVIECCCCPRPGPSGGVRQFPPFLSVGLGGLPLSWNVWRDWEHFCIQGCLALSDLRGDSLPRVL